MRGWWLPPAGSVLQIRLRYATAVLDEADVVDIAERWGEQLGAIADAVAEGPVGLSPSDVPGLVWSGRGLPRSPRMIWILLRCGSRVRGCGR